METKDQVKNPATMPQRTPCPECGSTNTFESDKPKEGHYLYCNHCGHEHWDD